MTNQEFLQMFCQSTSAFWEQAVHELLEDDERYQATIQREEIAEQKYLKLDLTEEQREIIDAMLLEKERNSVLYADACYLAGIRNTLQLCKALKV